MTIYHILDAAAFFVRHVIGEFPTIEPARHFYDSAEFQPALKLVTGQTRSVVVWRYSR